MAELLIDLAKHASLRVSIYQLLDGKLRPKLKVYEWIGGGRLANVEVQTYIPYGGTFSQLVLVVRVADVNVFP